MRLRVTKRVTDLGRVYDVDDVIDSASSREQSLRHLYQWELLPDPPPSWSTMKKSDYLALARARGVEVDPTSTKKQIRELLEES